MDKKRKYLELLFRRQVLAESLKKSEETMQQKGMLLLMKSLDQDIELKNEFSGLLLKTWIKEIDDEMNELQFDFDGYLLNGIEKHCQDKLHEIIEFYNKNKGSEEVDA